MYFIRHGQSQFNLGYETSGRDPDIPDAPLTPRGFEQAHQAGRHLKGKGVKQIISSPYTRALQTASAVASELGVAIHVEPLVGERCLYSCDIGTPTSILQQEWQELDFSVLETENWWPSMNESSGNLSRRIKKFTDKWSESLSAGGIAVVSHWYFLNALIDCNLSNGEVLFKDLFSDKHK